MKNLLLLLTAVTFAATALTSPATVLTGVPMQGGMVMPKVSYNAATDSVQVQIPPKTPQLTPLLISHPGDSFDPADPWFESLDPSRQGASFSRRYGFVMDAETDFLPLDREMWIRMLSGSSELKAYRNSNNLPKAWDPIFGTGGTPSALQWNGLMFHPAFTAPPGTNNLNAIFEVYLIDTGTGLEVSNSSSGPLAFNWTNVSDGRPALELRRAMVVAWPAGTTANWVLESAEAPNAGTWTTVTNAPVIVDGQPCVDLDEVAAQQYFRMRYVP